VEDGATIATAGVNTKTVNAPFLGTVPIRPQTGLTLLSMELLQLLLNAWYTNLRPLSVFVTSALGAFCLLRPFRATSTRGRLGTCAWLTAHERGEEV